MVNTAENTSMVNVMFALFTVMFVITAMDIQKYHQGRHGARREASTAAVAAPPAPRVAGEFRVRSDGPPPAETNTGVENRAEAFGKPAEGSRAAAVEESGGAVSAGPAIRSDAATQDAAIRTEAGRKTDAGIEMKAGAALAPVPASSAASSLWESGAAAQGTGGRTDAGPETSGAGIAIQPLSVDEDAPARP